MLDKEYWDYLQTPEKVWELPRILQKYSNDFKYLGIFFGPKWNLYIRQKIEVDGEKRISRTLVPSEIQSLHSLAKRERKLLIVLSLREALLTYPHTPYIHEICGNLFEESTWERWDSLQLPPSETICYINHSQPNETLWTLKQLKRRGYEKFCFLLFPRPSSIDYYEKEIEETLGLHIGRESIWDSDKNGTPIFLLSSLRRRNRETKPDEFEEHEDYSYWNFNQTSLLLKLRNQDSLTFQEIGRLFKTTRHACQFKYRSLLRHCRFNFSQKNKL